MVSDLATNKPESTVTKAERTRSGRTYVPSCDIIEQENELLLLADIPGVRAEDLDISYERGLLTIQGRVSTERQKGRAMLHHEYGVGDFSRSFQIGEGIDAGRIEAEVKNGVLTLHLPKAASVMPRKIAVKAE